MISSLLIPQNPVQFLPSLAREIGTDPAIVLQQVHFLLVSPDNDTFFEGKPWQDNIEERCCPLLPGWPPERVSDVVDWLFREGYLVKARRRGLRTFTTINYERMVHNHHLNARALEKRQRDNFARKAEVQGASNRNHAASAPYQEQTRKISRSMEDAWNQVNCPGVKVERWGCPSFRQAADLKNFMVDYLMRHGVMWEEYCATLGRVALVYLPKPLFGQRRLTLAWAIHPVNAVKVIEAILADKPDKVYPLVNKPDHHYLSDIEELAGKGPYSAQWVAIWQVIARYLSQGECTVVFTGSRIVSLTHKRLVLQVRSPLVQNYILAYMRHEFRLALEKACPGVSEVFVQVDKKAGRKKMDLGNGVDL